MTQQSIYFVSILFVAGFGIAFRWGYVIAEHVIHKRLGIAGKEFKEKYKHLDKL